MKKAETQAFSCVSAWLSSDGLYDRAQLLHGHLLLGQRGMPA